MAQKTSIEWTDFSWNPIRGCTRVSSGCGGPGPHGGCYAEGMAARFSKPGQWGHGFAEMRNGKPRWTGKVALIESMLILPLTWKTGRRIFVNSTSDLFHEALPDEAIDRIFAVMALAQQHTFQILTKRPERMRAYMDYCEREALWMNAVGDLLSASIPGRERPLPILERREPWLPLPNVWLGVSVEDQATADERIPDLLATPAVVRFVSYEPALGPVSFNNIDNSQIIIDALRGESWEWRAEGGRHNLQRRLSRLNLVIGGGESGPHARPAHPDWFRSARDQCATAGAAYFHKQNGEWAPAEAFGIISDGPVTTRSGGVVDWMKRYVVCTDRADRLDAYSFTEHATNLVYRVGKARAGRLLDGRTHDEMPALEKVNAK